MLFVSAAVFFGCARLLFVPVIVKRSTVFRFLIGDWSEVKL